MRIPREEVPWLAGAILFGAMLGPALLMAGLKMTSRHRIGTPVLHHPLTLPAVDGNALEGVAKYVLNQLHLAEAERASPGSQGGCQ